MDIQKARIVPVTAATPRILPPMISGTEAEESRTSMIRLVFSSMTLLSNMPAPVSTTIHSSMPIAKPAKPGSRSSSDTLPAAALGE